ncbi:MAG: hypothetical protein HY864_19130 [Chloroflexi bacterium]|nr:hypothetical protein [Chloroflexota bacterium]
MKNILFIVFLFSALTACASTHPNITDVQNTAVVVAWTQVNFTLDAMPAGTPTATIVYPVPSPIPTQPPVPILTPNANQVERWKEYQMELAKAILYGYDPASLDSVICEWDILGQSGQEVYVWAECSIPNWGDDSRPAVIYLNPDGSIQNIEILERGSEAESDSQRMFPADVREKFDLYYTGDSMFFGRRKEFIDHTIYRETHPEDPPLIILSAMPTVNPTP